MEKRKLKQRYGRVSKETKGVNKGKLLLTAFVGMNFMMSESWADVDQANADGKDFAKSMNSAKVKDAGKHVDPASIPGFQGANVPEVNHYGLGLNIENK